MDIYTVVAMFIIVITVVRVFSTKHAKVVQKELSTMVVDKCVNARRQSNLSSIAETMELIGDIEEESGMTLEESAKRMASIDAILKKI